jgi:hypothetical protein
MELEAPDSSTSDRDRGQMEESMRVLFVGALLGASLVIGAMAGRSSSEPPRATAIDLSARAASGELFTQVTATDGQPLTVTVVDPRQRVLAIYHVERTTGEITLKGARNITWDLQMTDYNTGKPLPQDIRNGLPH